MKMKTLFVLLAAITLVACSSNASKLPSSSLEGDSSNSTSSVETTSDSSNTTTSTSSNNAGTSSTTTSSSSSSSSSSSNHTTTDNTLTFNFYNNEDLPGCDKTKLNERLTAFMNKAATFAFVSSITSSDSQIIANAPNSGDTVLTIGSGSNKGEVQFTFANTIKSVSITAWSYHKPYTDYSTGNLVPNIDAGSSCYVNVDTNLIDLAPVNGEPVEKTQSFDINGKTLKLYNKAEKNRAFIKSMTFTY